MGQSPAHADGLPCPVPCLDLGTHHGMLYQPGSGRMVNDFQHRAALSFRYGEQSVSGRPRPHESSIPDRDLPREQQYREQLLQFGFSVALRQSQALPKECGEMFELASDATWLGFVQKQLPQLQAAGWQIRIHTGFAFDLVEIEGFQVDISSSPQHGGFDLDLGVRVEGQFVSLVPPLIKALQTHTQLQEPQFLQQRRDHEVLRLSLPPRPDELHSRPLLLPFRQARVFLQLLQSRYPDPQQLTERRLLSMSRADSQLLQPLSDLELQWCGDQAADWQQRITAAPSRARLTPKGLQAGLRDYQRTGVRWMQKLAQQQLGGILADDMGLGKTLQTLAHLLLEKESGRLEHPALIVVPTSLVHNWVSECNRFAPALDLLALCGNRRQQHFADLHRHDLILTTYSLLSRDIVHLQKQPFHILVLDEAQYIKNPNSKLAQVMAELNSRSRLCLTGTPVENNLSELWSLFNFLMPGWLGSQNQFRQDYQLPIENQHNRQRLEHLHRRISPYLLRRQKEQVARELPPKNEITLWVELSPAQREQYERIRREALQRIQQAITDQGLARSQLMILDALLKLRQACCDLRLLKELPPPGRRTLVSQKLEILLEMLDEQLAAGHRVLLFSQFTSMLALIEEALNRRRIRHVKITGQTTDRQTPVREFQSGAVPVFLISLKAGGTGLNLTAADTVIHFDPWWNPAVEDQATDRAHRIGQDKPVFVYRLITRGTVEERIQQLQKRKAGLAADILEYGGQHHYSIQAGELEHLLAPMDTPLRRA